jgi:hypothetical protein
MLKHLKTLKDAAAIDTQKRSNFFTNLGLLHYELGDIASAVKSFSKGCSTGVSEFRIVLQLRDFLLQQTGGS